MKIIIDTREQAPFTFRHERMGATTEPGTLAVGDYSLAGLEDRVAVERKSLPDSFKFTYGLGFGVGELVSASPSFSVVYARCLFCGL